MIIFSVIFLKVFGGVPPRAASSGLENFPLYFLSGLLPFQFFSISVTASIGSLQGVRGLIKKVAFPHEHLVLSIVLAQFVTVCIELVVLSVTFLVFGHFMFQWLVPMAALLVLIAVFTTESPWRCLQRTCSSTTSTTCGASSPRCCFMPVPIIWVM